MTPAETAELLGRYCLKDQDTIRPWMLRPLRYPTPGDRYGSLLWASNSHILICMPDDPGIEAQEIAEAAKILPFLRQCEDRYDVDFQPLPVIDLGRPCIYCHGIGRAHRCDTCPHHPRLRQRDGDCDDIEGCWGDGFLPAADGATECPDCGGSGVDHRQSQQIGSDGQHYAVRYLTHIATLPGIRFAPGVPTDDATHIPTAYFRFDGGWGALMPVITGVKP